MTEIAISLNTKVMGQVGEDQDALDEGEGWIAD